MNQESELFKILTAYRFIAMLIALLVALMGHYNIAIDQEVSRIINAFIVGFIGVNSGGKWASIIGEAIKSANSQKEINGEI